MIPKVLVADTEPWARDLIETVLDRYGVEVLFADSGLEALERFRSDAPRLLVVDAVLPRLGGIELAAKCRASPAGRLVPVVVTTALYGGDDQLARLRAKEGVSAVLGKPFDEAQCEAALAPLLVEEPHAVSIEEAQSATGVLAVSSGPRKLDGRVVGEVLLELMRDGQTGALTVRHSGIVQTVFFDRGQVVLARSNSTRDQLSLVLRRAGGLTMVEVDRARDRVSAGDAADLPAALVELDLMTAEQCRAARVEQLLGIVHDLVLRSDADYRFQPYPRFPPEHERFELDAAPVVFWTMRRMDGGADLRARLPSPRSLLKRTPASARLRVQAGLTSLEEQVLALIDGRHRLGDVLSVAQFRSVDVARVLLCLLNYGIIEAVPPSERLTAAQDPDLEPVGELAEVVAAQVFARLGLSGASGRLRLARGDEQRRVQFDHGEVVWARSSLDDHLLGRVLLDIGAVSESDLQASLEQQTELSGRRLGGLLLERQALTLEELDRGRRAQIQRIVGDALTWTEGRYEWEPREGGDQDQVTLPVPTSELVFESLRRLAPPESVRQLLDSDDAVLMKVWDWERIERDLSLSRSERRLLEVLEAGQTGADLTAFGLMTRSELERAIHGFLVLTVVQAIQGQVVAADAADASGALAVSELVAELDGDGDDGDDGAALVGDGGDDAGVVRLGGSDDPELVSLRRQLEDERAENERLRERIARLEAALDRRS